MHDYNELRTELAKPAYLSKTDAECLALLTTKSLSTPVTTLDAAAVFEAVVPAEFAPLTADQKNLFYGLLGMGAIRVAGTNTRAAFASLFGPGTATRAALLALASQPASWADLYWPNLQLGNVSSART